MPISQHAATQPLPTIPGFTLSELLYDGPKTATYRAQSSQKNQNVIIKVLQQEYPSFSDLVQFRNQYTLTHNLPIPNVIRSLSLEPWQNGYALVMEDFGGISLADHVKAQPPSLIETLAIGVQMAEILHDLGQHRLIHKDIKPANILIHPDSRQVKLTDFSISSLLPKETQSVQHPNELAKGLEGTLAYLAPEQTGRMNRGIDYRADFYALGVTLYELLVGELPFESEDPLALVHAHIATPPVAPHQRQPAIPPMVSDIVLKLMAKNAEDRYQSAKGLKHDLERSLHQWKETETIDPFELGRQDVCDRFLIPEKLYGREQEVQTLLSAFDRTASGSLEMMLVAGFSGIGKTAVVNEVHKPITRLQGYFISGKYDQFNRDLPLSAFVQAFRGLIKQLLGTSEEQLGNWRRKILEAVGDNGQLLIAVIPELVQVIGPQPPVNELAGTAAQNRFNRLFQQFISIFATAEHPLVVFLDDLQWADATSLYLLERLLGKGEQGHLLIIGAYRDNEVSAAHPLMLTLDKLAKEHATINTISLAPLSQDSLNTLVANTLQCASSAATPITQLIYQKTQGNPFFSTQFLKALYDNQLITFDWEAGGWQCDVAQVKAQTLTDDVVEFMAGQLKKLSPKTQQVLKLSACIGNRFDLATLAIVHEKSRAETAIDLWSALQAGLIVPTSEVYKFYQSQADQTQKEQTHEKSRRDTAADCSNAEANSTYRFLHDRVQQAAYSLIPEEQKKRTHFKVGQRLSQVLSAEEQTEKLFEIVNQLNFGQAFVMSPAEKENLIRLNLAAGRKAKASTAYGAAVQYFAVGRALLGGNGWQTDYGLSLSLYEEAAEAAYLNTDFEQSEQLSSVVLQQANTLLDKINVYIAKIQSRISQANLIGALQIALPVLTLLDSSFSLPETPTPDDFQQAFAETQSTLAGRSTRDLLDLPTMEAPHQLATIRILSSIAPPAYIGFPALLPLIAMRMVDLSVKFGNTPSSAFGYAMYGFILCGVMDDIESGYPMSQLALDLVDKYNAQHIKAKVLLLAGHFINPWKDNIHENMQLLPKAYQAGLASGDLEFSAYAAGFYCFNAVFTAKPLKGLDEELSAYADAIASIKQNHTLPYISISRQVVLNLLQQTEHPTRLVGEAYDESSMVEHHKKTNNRTALAFFYTAKLNLAYLFGDCERAKTYAAKAQEYLDGVVAMFCIVLVNFYDSLVKLALYPQAEDAEQRYILEQVAQNQLKMKYWADNAPVNYLHKFYLVEAERDRVLGNKASALENYDLAIADAKAHGFCQDEAIANELAANFYLAWEKTSLAKTYLHAAYYGYIRWGAKAKTSQLEQQPLLQSILHSELHPTSGAWSTSTGNTVSGISQSPAALAEIEQAHGPQSTISQTLQRTTSHKTTSAHHQQTWLDLPAVMKAAQAISQAIELDKLVATLMQTVIIQAGASCGYLLLNQDELWQVVASANQTQTQHLAETLEGFSELPHSLIYSVIRTQETAVFDNLTIADSFAGDRYVMAHQPQSALCTPISRQGALVGILYLENNTTAGAFTRDRLESLQLLTSQAAISLENARLYQKTEAYSLTLEAEVALKTKAVEQKAQALEEALQKLQQTQAKLIHTEKMSSLGQMVAGVAHEVNNPVNFIQGNLKHTRGYLEDLVEMLTLYEQEWTEPSEAIEEMRAELDLDFVMEDATKSLDSMKSGCDRIKQIVLSLRNFARLDESAMKTVDLHDGLESTLLIVKNRLQASAEQPAIQIVQSYGELPNVTCYASQINQVFLHLLNNAIDAIREQTEYVYPPEIRVHTEVIEKGEIRVAIANNGKRIPTKIQDRIFDPFFTTKPIGQGAGLGLYVSYSILQKHGGRLGMRSITGDSSAPANAITEFEVILPQVRQR